MLSRLFRFVVFSIFIFSSLCVWSKPFDRPAVMAPLEVKDWDAFKRQLKISKDIGVQAVSTDVWWGLVENDSDQKFDWSYYDKVLNAITEAGLKWTPILSFHQCGGNVGDDCDIPIPKWIWATVGGDNPDQLKYKSEQGKYSNEVIALWSDEQAAEQYIQFITEFSTHFKDKFEDIEEINVSTGASGELRYPSYNAHDSWVYPGRGFLQSYSDNAIVDFRNFVQQRYTTLDALNKAWSTELSEWESINPPSDANGFFSRKDYKNIQYGKDFTQWYNNALVKHGRFMLTITIDTLGDTFPGTPLGMKIPGVHWLMSDASPISRSAEISAGLIPTNIDFSSDDTARGYQPIIDMVKSLNSDKREIVLHFTCLEMNNDNKSPNFSEAKNLVFWVGNGARHRGVTIMGENALSGGITNNEGWNNIENAIEWSAYTGLTTLRVGTLENNNNYGFSRYKKLIDSF